MGQAASQGSFAYDFQQPVKKLDDQIADIQAKIEAGEADLEGELENLVKQRDRLLHEIVSGLTPYQRVKLARHPARPQTRDYIPEVFDDFVELHGDRCYGDDKAIVTGFARLDEHKVMLVGQQKGRETEEKIKSNFGMPQPEGYRKALCKIKLAEKYNLPVVSMIDTPGAAPALEAEERGQGMAIARNIFEMAGLRTPIIIIITGEGCSGGALGIGIGDRHAMLENAYYSVISPEGCAAILFHDSKQAEEAARALRITAKDMLEFGVIDEIIEEPLGGAQRDPVQTAFNIRSYLSKTLDELKGADIDQLLEARYERYRSFGDFVEVD
jgi:acetyl-CoA carboxylase carboxyl transferase subunit alpha